MKRSGLHWLPILTIRVKKKGKKPAAHKQKAANG
jgi:hypothetical protein